MNSAFNMNDFNFISSYFKKNSSIYTSMKSNFQNRTNVTMISPQVLSVHRNGHTVRTTIQHIDHIGNYINKDYELEIDNDDSNMQLVKNYKIDWILSNIQNILLKGGVSLKRVYQSENQSLLFIVILGSLTAFGPLAIDMFLPGLPNISHDFDISASTTQLTISFL